MATTIALLSEPPDFAHPLADGDDGTAAVRVLRNTIDSSEIASFSSPVSAGSTAMCSVSAGWRGHV